MSKVTETLRKARIAANVSQRELAELIGLTPQFLSDIERGRREFPVQRLADLPNPIRTAVVKAALEELDEKWCRARDQLLSALKPGERAMLRGMGPG
jgi:transcriptional regulator with XRE-family HTH domain